MAASERYEVGSRARELAAAVGPLAAEADESTEVDSDVLDALRQSGLAALVCADVDPVAICVIREELFPACAHLDSLFAMQGIGSYAITLAGSDQQRSAWLPKVAALQVLAALAVTEPDAGTDLHSLRASAVERGGRLHLTGSKAGITNAGAAGFYSVLAREGEGYSLVLVPASTPGLSVRPGPDLIAPHVIGALDFDVELPVEARIGRPGQGMNLVLATLGVFRVSVAAAAVGLASAALAEAGGHAQGRRYGKGTLARVPAVAEQLSRSWTEIQMARLFTYDVAARARRDPLATLHESSLAKAAATEMAGRVVDRCVQVMGRFGLERGSKIERYYRAARPMRIYEGANEALWHSAASRLFPGEA